MATPTSCLASCAALLQADDDGFARGLQYPGFWAPSDLWLCCLLLAQLFTKLGALNVPQWYEAGKVYIEGEGAIPFGACVCKFGHTCIHKEQVEGGACLQKQLSVI
eukprot:541554-Pelagomonas_calceolata.AAC.3